MRAYVIVHGLIDFEMARNFNFLRLPLGRKTIEDTRCFSPRPPFPLLSSSSPPFLSSPLQNVVLLPKTAWHDLLRCHGLLKSQTSPAATATEPFLRECIANHNNEKDDSTDSQDCHCENTRRSYFVCATIKT